MESFANPGTTGGQMRSAIPDENRMARIPSLEQLMTLVEEARTAPEQVLETPPVPTPEPVPTRARTLVDLPSLQQLTQLKAETGDAESEPAAPGKIRTAAVPIQKRPANATRVPAAAAAKTKKAAPQKIVKKTKPKPAVVSGEDVEANTDRGFTPDFSSLPTLDQLQAYFAAADRREETTAFAEPRQSRQGKDLPSLSQLMMLRDLGPEDSREEPKAAPRERAAEAHLPVDRESASASHSAPERSASKLPTVDQLKSLLSYEAEYGDVSFQELVREIRNGTQPPERRTVKEEPRSAAITAEEAPVGAQEEAASVSMKSPEDFVPFDFPDPERVDPEELVQEEEKKKGIIPFFAKRKSRKENRKNGTARFPYLINSPLRTN